MTMMKRFAALLTALALLAALCAPALAAREGEYVYAVVNNPKVLQRLHLRKTASSAADSLGMFYTGTLCIVQSRASEWTRVQIGDLSGYMMTKYLDFYKNIKPEHILHSVFSATVQANGRSMVLRDKPDAGSPALAVLASGQPVYYVGDVIGGGWAYVRYGTPENGVYGYAQTSSMTKPRIESQIMVYVHGASASEKICLRSRPNDQGDIIAALYSGACLVLDSHTDAYAQVHADALSGYVSMEDITPYPDAVNALRVLRVIADDTPLLDVQNPSRIIASMPSGALALGFADADDGRYVYYNGTCGRVKAAMTDTGVSGIENLCMSIPQQGYAFTKGERLPDGDKDYFLVDAPNGTSRTENGYIGSGAGIALEVLAQTGEWFQARHRDSSFGYIAASDVYVYMNTLLKNAARGVYAADCSPAAGLYTFTSRTDGHLSVTDENGGSLQSYQTKAKSRYTLFIPQNARVSLSGGTLSPYEAPDAYFIGRERLSYAGSGRLLCGYEEEIDDSRHLSYTVTCVGTDKGSFVISDIARDAGDAVGADIVNVFPGETREINPAPGQFLYFENCTITCNYGNG